jgi:hypothetical protein
LRAGGGQAETEKAKNNPNNPVNPVPKNNLCILDVAMPGSMTCFTGMTIRRMLL